MENENKPPSDPQKQENQAQRANSRELGPFKSDDYDPYLHREVENPTTNAETLIHLLKCSLGSGILAMPKAFQFAGFAIGLIGTPLIASLCTYCLHVLIRTQYIMCKSRRVALLSYPETMQLALQEGPQCLRCLAVPSTHIVNGFLIFYQLGICCVYIVFTAQTLKQICDYHFKPIDVRIYMCIILLPLILLNLVRDLKHLAPFSTFANLLTFTGLGIIFYYIFNEKLTMDNVSIVGSFEAFPLFFGIVLFSLEAVGVIIALESNMESPAKFIGCFGVLNIGMACIVALYTFVGAFGYIKYGNKCLGSITLNLPEKEGLAQAVKIMMALAILVSYGLQCYVPNKIIWEVYILPHLVNKDKTHSTLYFELALRGLIVLFTFLLAIIIPHLGLIISLIGAFCLSLLGITFPALIELCVHWPDKFGRYNYLLVKDIAIILFGLFGLVSGTVISVWEILTLDDE